MTVLSLVFKTIMGQVFGFLKSLIVNWKITLPIAGAVFLGFFVNHYYEVKADRDAIAYSYKVHLAQDKEAADARKAENARKEQAYQSQVWH